MSWDVRTTYYDAIGREWIILAKTEVKGTTVLLVRCLRFYHGIYWQYALAVVEDDAPDRATVLLKDGFTTIYDEVGE